MKSPFYKFTGFEANIIPDRNNSGDFYSIKWHVVCTERTLREWAFRFIVEKVLNELRQYKNPFAHVFVTVYSPFPAWDDDVLFAKIWINENGEPCASLLAEWEDI